MIDARVVGIGSPLGWDRLGWAVIEELRRHDYQYLPPGTQAELKRCDRPGSLLLEYFLDTRQVILVDAVRSGVRIGTVHRYTGSELRPDHAFTSSHAFGVAQAIALADTLDGLPESIVIYGIEVPAVDAIEVSDETLQRDLGGGIMECRRRIVADISSTGIRDSVPG